MTKIRQFQYDGLPVGSGERPGETWVYQIEDDVVYLLYSSGYKRKSMDYYACKPEYIIRNYPEIPQDKLYFQDKYNEEASFIKDNNLISVKKLCNCDFQQIMAYGCKCGGI